MGLATSAEKSQNPTVTEFGDAVRVVMKLDVVVEMLFFLHFS